MPYIEKDFPIEPIDEIRSATNDRPQGGQSVTTHAKM